MNHTTYIKNLFYSYMQDSENDSERIMIIKHFNTLNLNLEDIEKIVGSEYKEGLLYHRFSKNDIKEPYEPFMNGIRYYYQKHFSHEMTVQEFIDKCDVYSLHREIFISYLSEGRAKRDELIIISEVSFEKEKFIASIINCFNFIAKKKKILIVLNRFQFTGRATLDLVKKLLKNLGSCEAKLLMIYNELQPPLSYIEEAFDEIVRIAEEKNVLFEWVSDEEEKSNDYHATFIPNKRFFGEYLRKLSNLSYMLANDDAEYYVSVIHNRLVEEKLKIDRADKFNFYTWGVYCSVTKNDYNTAMLMCERLLSLYDRNTDLLSDFIYNYLCGQIQMMLVQSDLTIKYASKCKEIAEKANNEKMDLYADILYLGAQYSGWKDVFSVDFQKVTVDLKMIEKLKKYNFKNILAHYLAFGYDNDEESIKRMVERGTSDTYEEAVSIGHELGNTYFLLTTFTKYTVMFTDRGYYKFTDKFYKEKYNILSMEDNQVRQAHLLLGMGYNCIVSERYEKANEYFEEAIRILYKAKIAEEVIEALYNVAVNSICAEDYLSACDYLNLIFKMLGNLGMETIQICNASKIHGLLALSYYKTGNEYRCYRCLTKIQILISHFLNPEEGEEPDYYRWHEDLFLYYMLCAILNKNNGEYEEAGMNFEKARFHFESYSGGLFYLVKIFITEYYDYFMKKDSAEEAEEILKYGLDYCEKNGYVQKAGDILAAIGKKKPDSEPLLLKLKNTNLDSLVELSYNVGKEKQLEERKRDIRFLSAWQELLNREDIDYNMLVNNAMMTLQNNFNLDGILLIEITKSGVVEVYKDDDMVQTDNYDEIIDFFRVTKKGFIANRTDENFLEYSKLVSIFGKNKIVTLAGIPIMDDSGLLGVFIGIVNMHRNFRHNRILMNEDDLVIMKTAIIQLNNGIERIRSRRDIVEINEKLNELAVTDMLTGLYNRQGFAKMVEEHSNCSNRVAILYADLDNFKFYNDTFGHDVGDVVLKEFARVFESVSDGLGYAVRYGGDEFLVVLNNVDNEEACRVADKIYDAISDGFVPVVSNYVKQDVHIPRDKFVSCSIGIASSKDCSLEHINETMKKADQALYYMKKHKKGSYILWEDIHEESN